MNVSALLFEICRQFNARYTEILVPILLTTSSIRNVNCGPGHIQSIIAQHVQASKFNRKYLCCYWIYIDNSMCVILQTWCQIQRTCSSLRNVNCGPGHIQCIYSSANSGFIIQLKGSALILEIYRRFKVRCTANMLPNTANVLQFTLCELWSRHIQCKYSSAYSGFNIQLRVSALILEMCQQFSEPYTANLVQNTAHNLQFTQCGQCSRPYTL
jgi:hypothetical protein